MVQSKTIREIALPHSPDLPQSVCVGGEVNRMVSSICIRKKKYQLIKMIIYFTHWLNINLGINEFMAHWFVYNGHSIVFIVYNFDKIH